MLPDSSRDERDRPSRRRWNQVRLGAGGAARRGFRLLLDGSCDGDLAGAPDSAAWAETARARRRRSSRRHRLRGRRRRLDSGGGTGSLLRRRIGGISTGAGAGVSGWAGEGGTSGGRCGSGCGGTSGGGTGGVSGGGPAVLSMRGAGWRFRRSGRCLGSASGGSTASRLRRSDVLPAEGKDLLDETERHASQAARSCASAAGTAVSRSPSWPVIVGLDDLARLRRHRARPA